MWKKKSDTTFNFHLLEKEKPYRVKVKSKAGCQRTAFFWTDNPADDMKTLIFCLKHKENDVGIFRKYYVELSHFKKSYDNLEQSNRYFFAKKKSNTTYIDWMVEKYWYSMFFNEKSQEFPPALCHCFVRCTKKCFANHSRRPNVNILFVKCKKVSFIFTEKSVMISCSKFSFAKCWKARRTKKNNNHDLFFLLFSFAASTL